MQRRNCSRFDSEGVNNLVSINGFVDCHSGAIFDGEGDRGRTQAKTVLGYVTQAPGKGN